MSDIQDQVKKIVVDHLGIDESKVIPEAKFIDDLGADSLDTVELVMAFEEKFGIEIPGIIKWSPVKWRYKFWAGLYERAGQYLNVNRGFGYLAFPGRVGIWPEITVITLKKSKEQST